MRIVLIALIALQTSCSSIVTRDRRPASTAGSDFDVHIHLKFDQKASPVDTAIEELLQIPVKKGLVLSPAYLIDPRIPQWGGEERRHEYNQLTSNVIKDSNRFLGLCGGSYMWPDADKIFARCLKLPRMVGLKFRFFQYGLTFLDQVNDPKIRNQLQKIFELNWKKTKIVLVHMPNEAYWTASENKNSGKSLSVEAAHQRDLSSLEILLDLVVKYPRTDFILAHSLYEPSLVQASIDRFQGIIPDNLWIDLSTAFAATTNTVAIGEIEENSRKLVETWRKFGMNRILFGSDVTAGGRNRSLQLSSFGNVIGLHEFWNEQVSFVVNSPHLTSAEVEMIMKTNAIRFFSKVDPN